MIPDDVAWAKMPCSWQNQADVHKALREAPAGEAIAALKLYIALCLKANFKKKLDVPSEGCVKKSITELSKLIKTSRPMVIRGLRLLEKLKIIESLGGRPTTYKILGYESSKYWAKLPLTYLYKNKQRKEITLIAHLPNRTIATLEALQMYLYIASIRDKSSDKANVTYEKLCSVLNLTRNAVSRAISLLTSFDLVTVRNEAFDYNLDKQQCNCYWLRGTPKDPMEKAYPTDLPKEFPFVDLQEDTII